MTLLRQSVWVLGRTLHLGVYHDIFSVRFDVQLLTSVPSGLEEGTKVAHSRPALFIVDADKDNGADEWLAWIEELYNRHVVTIVVSRDQSVDRMREAARLGARDYFLLPPRPTEWLFRCEKILNFAEGLLPTQVDQKEITGLTGKERQLLAAFVISPQKRITRDQLFDTVWRHISVNRKTLDVHLFNVRRKLRLHGYDIVSDGSAYVLKALSC